MKYNPTYEIGTFEIGEIMDPEGVTFPGTAKLNIYGLLGEAGGGGKPKITEMPTPAGGNIINMESKSMVNDYTKSNYILAKCNIPHIKPCLGNHDGSGGECCRYITYPMGTKVVVIFLGGDINNPLIISVL